MDATAVMVEYRMGDYMDGVFKIFLASGVAGILISSLINLLISLRGFREQRRTQNITATLDFFRTKLASLIKLRDSLDDYKSVLKIHAITNVFASAADNKERKIKAGEWLDSERGKHSARANLYYKNRYLFSNTNRISLDAKLKAIEFPETISDLWIAKECTKSETCENDVEIKGRLSPERQEEIGIKILTYRFDLIESFESDLLLALEHELISATDILSQDLTSREKPYQNRHRKG